MDAVAGFFSALPEEMRDPVLFAIPCFLLLLILEWTAARKLESIETAATGQPRPASGAYLTRDSVASISMGLVSIATTAGWKSLALLGYAAIYAYLAPWQLSAHRWYTWVIAIVGVDLLYYSYHRIAHRVRLIWAIGPRLRRTRRRSCSPASSSTNSDSGSSPRTPTIPGPLGSSWNSQTARRI